MDNVTIEDALRMMQEGYRLEIKGGKIGNFIKEDDEC